MKTEKDTNLIAKAKECNWAYEVYELMQETKDYDTLDELHIIATRLHHEEEYLADNL